MRAVDNDYVAQEGEVLFSDYATNAELDIAFPGYLTILFNKQQSAIQKKLTDSVQLHMDSVAQSKGYDNIFSAATYAEEPSIPKFQAEGIAFRKWRSEVWDFCYAYLDDVTNGIKEVPTVEQLISELPSLVLP
jgi:hypothetical protein